MEKIKKLHFTFKENDVSKFLLTRFKETGDYYFLFQWLLQYEQTQEVWNSLKKKYNINEKKLEKTRNDFMYKPLDELAFSIFDFILSKEGHSILRQVWDKEENMKIPFFNGLYNFYCKHLMGKFRFSKYIEKYILKKLEMR